MYSGCQFIELLPSDKRLLTEKNARIYFALQQDLDLFEAGHTQYRGYLFHMCKSAITEQCLNSLRSTGFGRFVELFEL